MVDPGSADVEHFLLTRFSAVLAPGAAPASEEWLRYRLGFFVDATYSSVLSQSTEAFTWLVLLDDRCSAGFRADVERLAEGVFTPVWSHEDFRRDSFAAPVDERCQAPYVITTRVDSDDALAFDFMETVQAQFARQDRLFVSLTRGVQVDRSGAVYLSDSLSNPFLSLIERRRPGVLPDTVYVARHARARAHGPLREVRAPVMWAQVVHDLNVSNIVNGVRISPRVMVERFDIPLGYDASIGGVDLLAARGRQAARLGRLWAAHPGELTKAAEAWAWRLRGTHERPQDDGRNLSDRMQELERVTRTRWQGSRGRRAVSGAKHAARVAKWRLQRQANEAMPDVPRLVCGDLDAVLAADRVVVLAEYSSGRQLRRDAMASASAWAAAGLATVVVSARDAWTPALPALADVPPMVAVLQRPNVGYDFGSWAAVLRSYPQLAAKRLVVLTNDSLAGPFGPLDGLVARIESADAEVWSATANLFPQQHLQSYLMAFGDGVLTREPLREFFGGVRAQASKRDVVVAYELGLSSLVQRLGLRTAVGWDHDALGLDSEVDAALSGWARLLADGFPFVKRTLLEQRRFAELRQAIALVVRQEYGVRL